MTPNQWKVFTEYMTLSLKFMFETSSIELKGQETEFLKRMENTLNIVETSSDFGGAG